MSIIGLVLLAVSSWRHIFASVSIKDLGLPQIDEATEYQKIKGMCWTNEDELYNMGKPFKITLRDERGIMVTILADNYFGTYTT